MTEQPKTTSWLWSAGKGVNGMRINLDKQILDWYGDLACACDDSAVVQTYADFLAKGPAFGNPPEDVLEEMNDVIASLLESEATKPV
jgi:hypothetical protein